MQLTALHAPLLARVTSFTASSNTYHDEFASMTGACYESQIVFILLDVRSDLTWHRLREDILVSAAGMEASARVSKNPRNHSADYIISQRVNKRRPRASRGGKLIGNCLICKEVALTSLLICTHPHR